MKHFMIFLTLATLGITTQAQTATDSIKAAINGMFAAMKAADTVMLKNAFHETAIMQTMARNKEGATFISTQTVAEFAKQVSGFPKDAIDERIEFETIKIDGPVAAVWTPFKLYLNGKFYSCGVNSFQVVRINGAWKIQYIIDTRRQKGCE
jgi:UDP-N-acetylglucosamine enolpyruvyl transferase